MCKHGDFQFDWKGGLILPSQILFKNKKLFDFIFIKILCLDGGCFILFYFCMGGTGVLVTLLNLFYLLVQEILEWNQQLHDQQSLPLGHHRVSFPDHQLTIKYLYVRNLLKCLHFIFILSNPAKLVNKIKHTYYYYYISSYIFDTSHDISVMSDFHPKFVILAPNEVNPGFRRARKLLISDLKYFRICPIRSQSNSL